tara:strand:- start:21 stop:581 length:561 start_codon:yes stop_codon:yes gene_type:complete
MEERKHILDILRKVMDALQRKDYIKIKNLSNQFVHHSSVHQDADVISVAVIIYSLSKMIEREDYKKEKNWKQFYNDYLRTIKNMIKALEKNDHKEFHNQVEQNRKLLSKLSGNLKKDMKDVFNRAKINKASKIYEHGISMEKTAKILGITLWELAEYSGRTGVGNVNLGVTMQLKDRIKLAEEIFR